MIYRRPGFLVVLTTVTLMLATGCSASGTEAQAGLEKTDLTVAAVPTTDSTGLYVAMYEGLFAAQGLHINLQPAISAEQSVNQLALGRIDVLAGNYVSYIEAQINHDHGVQPVNTPNPSDTQISADLDIFAEASVMQPGFVGLFTAPGSPITTVADLEGKTIGLNAPGNVAYLLLASFMEANGVKPPPRDSKLLKYIPFPLMEQALIRHQVQVAFLAEPFLSIAELTAGVPELTNLDEGANSAFPIEGYAVTKQWARAYPRTLAAFDRALQEGQQIASTNRRIAELATEKYGLLPPKIAAEITAVIQFESYPIGQVDVTRLQRVADDMKQFGLIGRFKVKQLIGG